MELDQGPQTWVGLNQGLDKGLRHRWNWIRDPRQGWDCIRDPRHGWDWIRDSRVGPETLGWDWIRD